MVVISILLLHAILYLVGFRGQEGRLGRSHGYLLLHHTLPGYAIALAAALYLLWSFGRLDGLDLGAAVMAAIVVGLAAAIGAAIAPVVI